MLKEKGKTGGLRVVKIFCPRQASFRDPYLEDPEIKISFRQAKGCPSKFLASGICFDCKPSGKSVIDAPKSGAAPESEKCL
jgi:hypothetical protein